MLKKKRNKRDTNGNSSRGNSSPGNSSRGKSSHGKEPLHVSRRNTNTDEQKPRTARPQSDPIHFRPRSKVPGMDAFDNLPKRPPPDLPGYEKPKPRTKPPLEPIDLEKAKKEKRKKEKKEKKAKKQKARKEPKPINLAKRRRQRQLLAVMATLVLISAGIWFSFNVLFKIDKYSVQGENPYSEEEVINVFGYPRGENLFSFSIKQMEEKIEKELPYIEEVTIRRLLPGTVIFRVTPAVESYCLPFGDAYAVLSASRKVLKFAPERPEGLTILQGLYNIRVEPGLPLAEASEGEPGAGSRIALPASSSSKSISSVPSSSSLSVIENESEALSAVSSAVASESASEPQSSSSSSSQQTQEQTEPEGTGLEQLDVVLQALDNSGLGDITWVDVSDPIDLRFRWDDRITVVLGSKSKIDEKMQFVSTILSNSDGMQVYDNDRGELDVSTYPDLTDRVWLKPE